MNLWVHFYDLRRAILVLKVVVDVAVLGQDYKIRELFGFRSFFSSGSQQLTENIIPVAYGVAYVFDFVTWH